MHAPPPPINTATHTLTPRELAHRAKDEARDAGYERAGLFVLLIDLEDASRVIRALNTQEVMGICSVIARLDTVNERDARRVLEEYGVPPSTVPSKSTGGLAAVRRLLAASFDADDVEQLLERIQDGLA
jgi:flagellar motor switch protein FliG